MVVHANLFEEGNISKFDLAVKDKFVGQSIQWTSRSFEDEKLVCLLLVHDEDLATDNR